MNDVIGDLAAVDLEIIQSAADLQTRLDRKYIVPPVLAAALIGELAPSLHALQINDRRNFGYESVYFDTPALDSYFGSAHGRRLRFKVRTRSYLDSDACVLEVKTAGGRGHTVKERLPYDIALRADLDETAREFLRLNNIGNTVIDSLCPSMTTIYQRTTLLDLDGARVTIDSGLHCVGTDGRSTGLADDVLIETKSPCAATALDKLLWARGVRPVSVSKYCTGLAAITPGLPANKWNRTLRRHFGWTPQAA